MKRLTPMLCALAFLLTGCASMLEREYTSVDRHVEYPVSDGDSSVLQAETYPELTSAIYYFLTEHAATGTVRLSNYVGDVGADLENACAEVAQLDPLGAYALNGIEHSYTRIVSYYEVTLEFDYAHTAEELSAIPTVTGRAALESAVSSTLSRFDGGCVLLVNQFSGDEAALLTLIRQVWLDTPLAALEQPEVRVKYYPESGANRIAEITLQWASLPDDLNAARSELSAAAQRLLQELNRPEASFAPLDLLDALRQRCTTDGEGGSSPYDALVLGHADPKGTALALALLCQLSGLETVTVEGRLNGADAWWLIVETEDGLKHLDPSAQLPAYADDGQFLAAGYEWSSERYPACPASPESD